VAETKVFEVEVPAGTSVEDGLSLAREKARGVGIALEGDATGGTFTGAAEGRYQVDGRRLRLTVSRKPTFVPWAFVESGLRKVFGSVTIG